jgi:hypothetical protein
MIRTQVAAARSNTPTQAARASAEAFVACAGATHSFTAASGATTKSGTVSSLCFTGNPSQPPMANSTLNGIRNFNAAMRHIQRRTLEATPRAHATPSHSTKKTQTDCQR